VQKNSAALPLFFPQFFIFFSKILSVITYNSCKVSPLLPLLIFVFSPFSIDLDYDCNIILHLDLFLDLI
jgi:hypothetical protein